MPLLPPFPPLKVTGTDGFNGMDAMQPEEPTFATDFDAKLPDSFDPFVFVGDW